MCLDTLSSGDSLYMHVSKPPKDGSPASLFFKELKTAADQFPSTTVDGVHKKINLADDILAWEHERYSIRRLPAFTLSTLKSHRELIRGTILDTRKSLNTDKLVQNTKVIAEALADFIYNNSHGDIFGGSLVRFHFKIITTLFIYLFILIGHRQNLYGSLDKLFIFAPSFSTTSKS